MQQVAETNDIIRQSVGELKGNTLRDFCNQLQFSVRVRGHSHEAVLEVRDLKP
jgi:hypothetical protein